MYTPFAVHLMQFGQMGGNVTRFIAREVADAPATKA